MNGTREAKIIEVYKGRLYTGYGTSVENQQDSAEVI